MSANARPPASLFHEPSEAEWLDMIATELRGRDLEEVLWTTVSPGVRIRGFYRTEDRRSPPAPVQGRIGGQAWLIREEFDAETAPPERLGCLVIPFDPTSDPSLVAERVLTLTSDPTADTVVSLRPIHSTSATDPDVIPHFVRAVVKDLPAAGRALVTAVEWDPSITHPGHADRVRVAACQGMGALDPSIRFMAVDTARWADEAPASDRGAAARMPAATLARSFACVSEWLRAARDAELPETHRRGRVFLRVPAGMDYLLTIAYLRALRSGLSGVFEAWTGAGDPVDIHVVVPERTYTLETPESNLVRATLQCAAAVIGGADAVEIPAFDVRTGGSSRARSTARALHHLIREEGLLHCVADPAAGSYYLEQATEALGLRAWDIFCRVESAGGLDAHSDTYEAVGDGPGSSREGLGV